MRNKKKKIFIAFAIVLAIYLICYGHEGWPTQNWREYRSLARMWTRLKQEKIESIRFCEAISLEYGYDLESDFQQNVNAFGFRERAADVVRWWPSIYKVPKENLPECIDIINKIIKDTQRPRYKCLLFEKMLVVTGRGNYIFSEEEWGSDELSKFIVKYCNPSYEHWYFVPPKEQTVAILIFSPRKCEGSHDSQLVWPPVALLGDKKLAEELMGRSFKPKMVFEGRVWLEKIMDAYEVAFKGAKELHYRREDNYALKGWIVFLTQDEFCWKGIGINDISVFEDYIIESKQLKAYFDELGLTKELLAGKTSIAESNDAKTPFGK
jgi:hypothetical protein